MVANFLTDPYLKAITCAYMHLHFELFLIAMKGKEFLSLKNCQNYPNSSDLAY